MAVMAVVGLSLAMTGPAHATVQPVNEGGDDRPCMTWAEFEAVKIHMPRHRAERIIDAHGTRHIPNQQLHALIDYTGHVRLDPDNIYRAFPVCDDVDMAVIEFKRNSPRQRVVLIAFGLAPNS